MRRNPELEAALDERVIWTCVTAACLNNVYCGGEPFVMRLGNPR